MSTPRPTASTFREPLLRSLGTATNLTANKPVAMADVLPFVYTDSGIAEDAYGKDKNGWFYVRLWNQQCYKSLVKGGLAIKAGRGQWGLSEEGVKVASALLTVTLPATPTTTPVDAADDDVDLDFLLDEMEGDYTGDSDKAEEPTVVPPPVSRDGGEGVAWDLGPQENTYNEDPYIRGLAIESTKCFGEFSLRSDVCKTCPVSGACKATILTQLARVAEGLRQRDEEAARRGASPVKDPVPVEDDEIGDIIAAIEEEVDDKPKTPADADVRRMKVPANSKCRKCGKTVARGTEGIYVRGVGIYHIECHEE